ncbi:5-deoxy-glucuronate isomerase [Austwickia chelonae]|uniref:5-deoxy-glucuronate isomerase n=1 Tax=Austwickia chelonae NBRC 105200 TaxID=1184607 RepID=K6VRC3_9MICO|nr:5-deoxy-glucuronate isomerase [Austwickia chelonae]GAB79309.1 5-deoxy-glucuronate isomerase [Austwickia chelonae NBRC 105200]SEW38167.1 5-deoxy-glucuronate isomerase [Austwickia chelonae]
MSDWFVPAGSATGDGYETRISPGREGWSYTGLWTARLDAGESRTIPCGDCEWIALPLSGSYRVDAVVNGQEHHVELTGRDHVLAGPTDLAFIPRDSEFTVTATTAGTIALPHAKARTAYPFAYLAATDVPVELRGAGQASRQVQNFGTPGVLEADSLIACEVITPAGNWSSYPPHKHDTERDGIESELEEIYYFEMRVEDTPTGRDAAHFAKPFGYQRVYGTDDQPIDVLEEVRSGDIVLVPHGWHGPAMAPTGYDMYYLNVMAGPGEKRAWLICDDPAHAWVRGTWDDQQVDGRLPLHDH